MENDAFDTLQSQSALLRSEVPSLLEHLDDEVVDKARQSREEFRGGIQKVMDHLKDKIAEMESTMRRLRQMKTEQGVDCDKLSTRAFAIRRERKAYHA